MNRGFVSIDKEKGVLVTAATKGIDMQIDLTVLMGICERMAGARTQKMLYGIVTAVEVNAMQRVAAKFAAEAQRTINEEGAEADKAEAERLLAVKERAAALDARKRKRGTPLRRRRDGDSR